MAPRQKKTDEEAVEKERTEQNAREELAGLYRQVYDRCMEGEIKAFDPKGALSALEGLEKVKGLGAQEGGVTLTLGDAVGDRGD